MSIDKTFEKRLKNHNKDYKILKDYNNLFLIGIRNHV